jgi:predicted ATP-grasp superfamily ATP-dependent carboligase
LFYQQDTQLLMVSRYRDRLARAFRFVIPEAALVEDFVDKARCQAVSERLGLPVPPTRRIRPAIDRAPTDLGFGFPLIIKQLTGRISETSGQTAGPEPVKLCVRDGRLVEFRKEVSPCGIPTIFTRTGSDFG